MSHGTMTMGWTAWCAFCVKWDEASGSKKSAAHAFKIAGWTVRDKKWVCPECSSKKEDACAAKMEDGKVVPQ